MAYYSSLSYGLLLDELSRLRASRDLDLELSLSRSRAL
jgi:hypothetical protein